MDFSLSSTVIDSQPQSSNGVVIRKVRPDDCEFVGPLLVQAFESKFAHAAGSHNLVHMRTFMTEYWRKDETYRERAFIAEVDGRRAGFLELIIGGMDPPENLNMNEAMRRAYNNLGCWRKCRFNCLLCCLDERVKRSELYISTIAVAEGFRGKGIGKCLMQVADDQARAANCRLSYLMVADDNPAVHLYQRSGYVTKSHDQSCIIDCIVGKNGFFKMVKKYQQ